MCKGENIIKTPRIKGSSGITIEHIIEEDPEVIITNDEEFYKNIYSNDLLSDISAVKNKRVYLVPQSHFSWFKDPPDVNTIIGIPWTANVLYPERFKEMDLKNITKTFYLKFYHYNITNNEAEKILIDSVVEI